jgi:hypothetical protein
MPQLHGIRFVWQAARHLQPGDELLLSNGDQPIVTARYNDGWEGTWLETDDGVGGYTTGRYRVIV